MKLGLGGWCCIALPMLVSCFAEQRAEVRLEDAADALNLATRFDRLDVAAQLTAEKAKKDFLKRRKSWGGDVRVVDIEVTGLVLDDAETAQVDVAIEWVRIDESLLRSTAIRQNWKHAPGDGWQLTGEKRLNGDLGLFGEARVATEATRNPDRHFPSKTISSGSGEGVY